MTVPYSFASASDSIPLSQLDDNFNTPFTLGNTSIQLGNTVTSIGNITFSNVTITSVNGNISFSNVSVSLANITTANVANLIIPSSVSTRVFFASNTKSLTTSSNLTFDGTTLSVNGVLVGKGANSTSASTAVGANALDSNINGVTNTGIGYNALTNNTTGDNNTAIGAYALQDNNSGGNNVGIGYFVLANNTSGSQNIGIGIQSIKSNLTGDYNIGIGFQSLYDNSSGTRNIGIGDRALTSNTIGNNCIAIGQTSLQNGTNNRESVAIGTSAMGSANNVANCVSFGYQSLYNCNGSNNVAVGVNSGRSISTGTNNVCVGPQSGNDAVKTITTENHQIVIGNNSSTNAFIKIAWTVTSDARDKTSFSTVPHGLEFVNSLTPTAYQFRTSREDETPSGPVRYGFKAQDILEQEGENPVIVDNNDPENLKYNQDSMIAVLANAIKELKFQNDLLKARLDAANI
jgi:hypothetical protein